MRLETELSVSPGSLSLPAIAHDSAIDCVRVFVSIASVLWDLVCSVTWIGRPSSSRKIKDKSGKVYPY